MVHVPRAPVPWRGRQQAAPPPGRKEGLHHLVPLRIRMAQIVALVYQHEIAVFVFDVVQEFGGSGIVIFPQKPIESTRALSW